MTYIPEYKKMNIDAVRMGSPARTASPSFLVSKAQEQSTNFVPAVESSTGHIIDNNEVVNIDAIKFDSEVEDDLDSQSAEINNFIAPKMDEYILMIFGKIALIGTSSQIEEKLQAIIYKEDIEYKNIKLDIDDITVLKKIEFKIGVFLDER